VQVRRKWQAVLLKAGVAGFLLQNGRMGVVMAQTKCGVLGRGECRLVRNRRVPELRRAALCAFCAARFARNSVAGERGRERQPLSVAAATALSHAPCQPGCVPQVLRRASELLRCAANAAPYSDGAVRMLAAFAARPCCPENE